MGVLSVLVQKIFLESQGTLNTMVTLQVLVGGVGGKGQDSSF